MFKFFRKYELGIKIFLTAVAILAGVWKIFLTTDVENKNFNRFTGIVWIIVTLFLLIDSIIGLVQKRNLAKEKQKHTAE